MEDGNISVDSNPAVDSQPASTQTSTADQSAPNVDYEQRFRDTQAAYTRSQQELSQMKAELGQTMGYLKEVQPHIDLVRQQSEFYKQQYAPQQPRSAYDYEDGVDGALRERDGNIEALKAEIENLKNSIVPQVQQANAFKTQQEFKANQYRLYQEFGAKEFGSAEAFGEVLKSLPAFVPNWEQQYMGQPSYDTLKQAYLTMRGALEYQQDSPLKQQIEAKRQQDLLAKQMNHLGKSAVQYGPSRDNPNQPYMTPISQS